MKNIKKYLFWLLIPILGVSCTDLEDMSYDAKSTNTPSQAGAAGDPAALLTGTYNQLNGVSGQAGIYALMEHSSDEMMGPTRGTDWSDFGIWRQLHLHAWDPTHNFVFESWNLLNIAQLRASQVINSSAASAQQKAEARFLRAFTWFYLVDLFGQVPYRKNLDDPNEIPSVYNRSEATDEILKEIDLALPALPSYGGTGYIRATKEAAHFLRAKVYLNKAVYTSANAAGPYTFNNADMAKVIESVDFLEASGFALNDSYFDNFSWTNDSSKEIVFGVKNDVGNSNANVHFRYFMTTHYNQRPSGWNGFTTVADFYNKWTDPNDERKGRAYPGMTDVIGLRAGFLEGQQFDGAGNKLKDRGGNDLIFTKNVDLLYSDEKMGIRVIKYLANPANLDNPGNDFIHFRFADALLMKAEAMLRSGNNAGALTLVNQLRTIRKAAPLASVDLDKLLDERGFELYWEGWRRHDQVRFGKFLQGWQGKTAESPAHVVLFPIPQRAMDTNPNLKQNPGY
jgi:starch-binding outer membrane protein, SusD/RagB family